MSETIPTLIIDAGSTKSDWYFATAQQTLAFSLPGLNPVTMAPQQLHTVFSDAFGQLQLPPVGIRVHYYGAGIGTKAGDQLLRKLFLKFCERAEVSIYSDLLGAARACCGHQAGIIAILGTGSNSGVYDGRRLVDTTMNLGWLVGDEGSGTAIGRHFLQAVAARRLNSPCEEKVWRTELGDRDAILSRLYQSGQPRAYLSGLSPLVAAHLDLPGFRQVAVRAFNEFIQNHLSVYPAFRKIPVNFVGSVASHFEPIVRECITKSGGSTGKFLKKPINCLAAYHEVEK